MELLRPALHVGACAHDIYVLCPPAFAPRNNVMVDPTADEEDLASNTVTVGVGHASMICTFLQQHAAAQFSACAYHRLPRTSKDGYMRVRFLVRRLQKRRLALLSELVPVFTTHYPVFFNQAPHARPTTVNEMEGWQTAQILATYPQYVFPQGATPSWCCTPKVQ